MHKKSQQEIAGFIIIVIIVTIIGIGFIIFSIGKSVKSKNSSLEINNLLESISYKTSSCAISFIPQYKNIQSLIIETINNPSQTCLNQKTVKEALEEEFKQTLEQSLDIKQDSYYKAYELKINLKDLDNEKSNLILEKSLGNFSFCSAIIYGDYIIPESLASTVNIELSLCKS
jgi:hypothetical protein